MERKKHPLTARLLQRLAALAAAAALTLSLAGCDAALATPGQDTPSSGTGQTADSTGLTVDFIDMGQALSVLVSCDGQSMLYDGGNVADGSLVVSYLQSQGVERLEYVICSHAHEDHVGGLAAVLAKFPAGHVYAPVTQADTQCFANFVTYAQN